MPPLRADLMLSKKSLPRFIGGNQVEKVNELIGEDGIKANLGQKIGWKYYWVSPIREFLKSKLYAFNWDVGTH